MRTIIKKGVKETERERDIALYGRRKERRETYGC